jgi:hypothetical protein
MTESGVVPDGELREKRRESRMSATRPVKLARGTGVTLNISTSGVFFETHVDYAPGSTIIFAIELDGPQGEKLMLKSRGEILRIDHRGGKVGVAVKILASKLEPDHPSAV